MLRSFSTSRYFRSDVDDRMLLGQLLQRVGVGRRPGLGLLHRREAELLEEDAPQLRRGVDVELLAGLAWISPSSRRHSSSSSLPSSFEELDVDADAGVFHAREHADERPFDALVQVDELACLRRFSSASASRSSDRDPPAVARLRPASPSRSSVPSTAVGRTSAPPRGSAARDLRACTSPPRDRGVAHDRGVVGE